MGQISEFINIVFTQPIFNALMLLYHLFGDFGLSIIVLTLVIRLILFPLTLKQLKSTKATQAIQPQLAEVRKKYKDQKEQYQAMQALYKEYGVNPAAGCLPLLIQLPVLWGLFYGFRAVLTDASLKGDTALHTQGLQQLNNFIYPFLPHFSAFPNVDLNWFTFLNPHWFIALGQPDPTHILPILAGLATFIQLRMSQPKNTVGAKDTMTQQMKMMQYIMPFFTVFIAWGFAAGLALYWTTSSVFGMVQQYFVTGWGALLITPNIPGLTGNSNKSTSNGSNKSYTGDSRRERQLLQGSNQPEEEVVTSNATRGRGSQTSSQPAGSSSVRRRSRSGSASSRRRGNAPRRNAPRS